RHCLLARPCAREVQVRQVSRHRSRSRTSVRRTRAEACQGPRSQDVGSRVSIATFIRNEIFVPPLRKASCLAVYDPGRRYREIVHSMEQGNPAVVQPSQSSNEAREGAMLALASLGRPGRPKELLVYVPAKPPITDEERQVDPFAIYAACGAIFPDGD